jgi:hypothetical protein
LYVRPDDTAQVTIGPFALPITAAERVIVEKFERIARDMGHTVERVTSEDGKYMRVVAVEERP